ncbi:MAG TPA: NAD-dependent epimerase/dehydratase family protein [Burkholderiales bacterium]|nr:NAD-dependent epimerase/dehydratase family protein [Burkholderiales bacterium]
MKVFMTGASGYIGGSVAAALVESGHQVLGLVRSEQRASEVRERGIEPVLGTLSDIRLLVQMTRDADGVINTASSDDRLCVEAMLPALWGTNKPFIHTSGSSIVADLAAGQRGERIYEDDTPVEALPGRAARVAIDKAVLGTARTSVRAVVICPTMIYGQGRGIHAESIQVPKLVALARKHGVAKHVGPGENIWSNVHIDDLVDLYLAALERAPAGAFYYAENGENSLREVTAAISRTLGFGGRTEAMSMEEAAAELGEGAASYSFGSNSRVRAVRARRELGWSPKRRGLIEDIERLVHAQTY